MSACKLYDYLSGRKRHIRLITEESMDIIGLNGNDIVIDITKPCDECLFVMAVEFLGFSTEWYIAANRMQWMPLVCGYQPPYAWYRYLYTSMEGNDPRRQLTKGDRKIIRMVIRNYIQEHINDPIIQAMQAAEGQSI